MAPQSRALSGIWFRAAISGNSQLSVTLFQEVPCILLVSTGTPYTLTHIYINKTFKVKKKNLSRLLLRVRDLIAL